MEKYNYRKLGLTAFISFAVMYATMYYNVDDESHVFLNLNRVYMSLLMVTPMVVIMLLVMQAMYTNRRRNAILIVLSAVVFGGSLISLRTQAGISDVQYMKAMIPHHSSAIMTSRHATFNDPEVKALAKKIIRSQEEEINEMKALIQKLKGNNR